MEPSPFVIEKPSLKWDGILDNKDTKDTLMAMALQPNGPPSSILFHGPPETSKLDLARAMATDTNRTLLWISCGDLFGMWKSPDERQVQQLFSSARDNEPSIIFLDGFDELYNGEDESGAGIRVQVEILIQIDSVRKDAADIIVLGAIRCPWPLSSSLRRRSVSPTFFVEFIPVL
jgi:SpoVK/Ycf46/Vps4 family AAA+-type ATPase